MMYQTRRRGVRHEGAHAGPLSVSRPFLTVNFDRSMDFDRGFVPGEGAAIAVIRSQRPESRDAISSLDLSTILDEEFRRRNRFQAWGGWMRPIRGLWKRLPRFR